MRRRIENQNPGTAGGTSIAGGGPLSQMTTNQMQKMESANQRQRSKNNRSNRQQEMLAQIYGTNSEINHSGSRTRQIPSTANQRDNSEASNRNNSGTRVNNFSN